MRRFCYARLAPHCGAPRVEMTVEYKPRQHHVLRYSGTVLPVVWRLCVFNCSLALLLCYVYDPIRRAVQHGEKKTLIYYAFHDCDAFFSMCTSFVTFVLSFFNANVFQRWWKLRELCGVVNGKTVDTTVALSALLESEEDRNELIRLLWLAHALHSESITIKAGGTQGAERLVQLRNQGLIVGNEELCALQQCSNLKSSTPLSIAYGWFLQRFKEALQECDPHIRGNMLSQVHSNVSAMRGAASDVLMYLSTPVPLAYTHLLEVTVTIYVVMAPFGLVPRLLWLAVPGCFVVTLVFYGFMMVGKLMLNPFNKHSDDSFEVANYLRSTRVACLEISAVVGHPVSREAVAGDTPLREEEDQERRRERLGELKPWKPFWDLVDSPARTDEGTDKGTGKGTGNGTGQSMEYGADGTVEKGTESAGEPLPSAPLASAPPHVERGYSDSLSLQAVSRGSLRRRMARTPSVRSPRDSPLLRPALSGPGEELLADDLHLPLKAEKRSSSDGALSSGAGTGVVKRVAASPWAQADW